MLGLGWTEMLVIGVVALIVIGPKELPVVMNRIGKVVGQIRRMGTEFQREINKTTGLDEVRNLRNSITEPLRKTSEEIRKEFNSMTPSGPKPSGIIKPKDPKAESVVDEIRAAAGLTPVKTADQIAAESGFKPPGPAPLAAKTAAAAKPAAVESEKKPVAAKKPAARKAPARAKAVPDSTVTKADLAPLDAAPATVAAPVKKAAPKKPAAKAPAKPDTAAVVEAAEVKTKPAPRKKAAAKPKAPAAEPAKTGEA